MLKEFRTFIARGNVMDLAVGVIIGAAFGKIVTSLVSDIIMPPLGLVLGKVDFSNLFINLGDKPAKTIAEAKAAGVPTLNYGVFIDSIIQFVILAFVVFLVVQAVSKIRCAAAPGGAGHGPLPLLRREHPGRGQEVRPLHVGPSGCDSRPERRSQYWANASRGPSSWPSRGGSQRRVKRLGRGLRCPQERHRAPPQPLPPTFVLRGIHRRGGALSASSQTRTLLDRLQCSRTEANGSRAPPSGFR